MSEKDDMNLNPEELYRQARQDEPLQTGELSGQGQEPAKGAAEASQPALFEADPFSDEVLDPVKLYQYDRMARTTGNKEQVEDILAQLHVQRSLEDCQALFEAKPEEHEAQNMAHQADADIARNRSSSTAADSSSLFSMPGRLLDRGVKKLADVFSAPGVRFAVPAAAMALLAVFIIPKVMDGPGEVGSPSITLAAVTELPPSLVAESGDIAGNMTLATNDSLGFASDTSRSSRMFNLGTLVTHVAVTAAAETVEPQQELLLLLDKFSSSEAQGVVKESVTELLAELSDPAHNRESVAQSLASLNTAIAQSETAADDQQWYLLGQNVEAVQLANNHAMQHDNSEPVVDTLTALHARPVVQSPDSRAPKLAELLQELQLLDNDEFPTSADKRTIDRVIAQIRVLLR